MSSYVSSLFAQAAAPAYPWYVNLLAAAAVIVGSVVLGGYFARRLRMPDHGWKISLCLFAFLASGIILLMGPRLKLGIDLSGGVILVYEIDQSQLKSTDSVDMDKLVAAVARRVNPGGQKEVTIRKYGAEQIEVIIPEIEEAEVERIKRIISTTGNLEFRILATQRANGAIVERALAEPSKMRIDDEEGKPLAWWVPVNVKHEGSFGGDDIVARRRPIGDREVMEILVINDEYNVTGGYLTTSRPGSDERGQPCVMFNFNAAGGQLFGQLTGDHLPPDKMTEFKYKLGIILDGELYSAPNIQSQIREHGQITGRFTMQEVQELVNILNAGSLPVALSKQPVSELYSGPTLGRDTIEKGTMAMIISSILVPLFMLWYYRFCGLVANLALVLNMMVLFAVMLTIKAAFTLTGFAALALAVGMAVDNNVLIYERLREELERGATLRMAIRNAFQRASAVIIDANLTTLIAATVLYVLGTDQLRGFAVPLWLGVAISIFTSVFVSRVIFDIAEKRRWITEVKMLKLIGHTHFDFMHWFRYTFAASILITIMAIGVSIYRGQGLFDIDFTGGVSVQALFNQPQDISEVRKALEGKLEDLAVSDAHMANEQEGVRVVVNTSEPEMEQVRRVMSQVFGDKLKRNSVKFEEPKQVESAAQPAAPAAKPAEKDQSRNDLPASTLLALAGDKSSGQWAVGSGQWTVGSGQGAVDSGQLPGMVLAMAADDAASAEPNKEQEDAATPPTETAQPKTESPTATPASVGPDPYAGGSMSVLSFAEPVKHQAVEQLIAAALDASKLADQHAIFQLSNPQYVEGDHAAFSEWTLKILLPPEKTQTLLSTLQSQVADSPIFPASSTIGGAVAGHTQRQAALALVVSWVCMIIYLWLRFQGVAFGLAAVAALIHDVFVMLGAVAVSIYVAPYLGFLMIDPFKINLPIVAAFLTIIGYSVNDTIVIFDRIREVRGKNPDLTVKMVNDSVNQTLSRTLLTSFTVFLVVVVLYLFGGDAIHGFAFALIVGVATGTYSSIYIASPILLWLVGRHNKGAAKSSSR